MNRQLLLLVFGCFLIYGLASKSGGPGPIIDPIIDPSNNITSLAEDVMTNRAKDTAKAYREISQLLKQGDITSSFQLGTEMNARTTAIDKDTAVDFVAAMKPTLSGDEDLAKDDTNGIKKWQEASAEVLQKAAKGFERSAR